MTYDKAAYMREVAKNASEMLAQLLGQLIEHGLPSAGMTKDEVDRLVHKLRGVHEALAFHTGTVGQLIVLNFSPEEEAEVSARVLEEQQHYLALGIVHANGHAAEEDPDFDPTHTRLPQYTVAFPGSDLPSEFPRFHWDEKKKKGSS